MPSPEPPRTAAGRSRHTAPAGRRGGLDCPTTSDPGRGAGQDADPSLDQRFDRTGLYALRAAVAAHADELGTTGRHTDDLVLIAHELASNAVRHGGGHGRLRLWRRDRQLYCEVTDVGAGLADPDGAGRVRPPPTLPGGRGLWLVHQLATGVAVTSGPDGTTVTAVVALPPSG